MPNAWDNIDVGGGGSGNAWDNIDGGSSSKKGGKGGGLSGFLKKLPGLGRVAAKPLLGILELLDIPGAAARSGAKEAVDALGHGKGWFDKKDDTNKASLQDFKDQFNKREGFGDWFNTGNIWADRAVGATGDILTDPLTYLSLGAGVGLKGGKAASKLSKPQIAKLIASKTDDETANLFLKGENVSDALNASGIERGAVFGVKGAKVRVPGSEPLYDALSGLTSRSDSLGWLKGKFDPLQLGDLRKTDPLSALKIEDIVKLGSAESRGLEGVGAKSIQQTVRGLKKEGVDQSEWLDRLGPDLEDIAKSGEDLGGGTAARFLDDPELVGKADSNLGGALNDYLYKVGREARGDSTTNRLRKKGLIEDVVDVPTDTADPAHFAMRARKEAQITAGKTADTPGGFKATDDVAKALKGVEDFFEPVKLGTFLTGVQAVTSRFKSYALLNPGTHARNAYSALAMNFIDGMPWSRYGQFGRLAKIGRDNDYNFAKITDKTEREAMEKWIDTGAAFGRRSASMADQDLKDPKLIRGLGGVKGVAKGVNPFSLDNYLFRGKDYAFTGVESMARGPLFFDEFVKVRKAGGTADEATDRALERVAKVHFDYDMLTPYEKKYVRGLAVPFYTWTRKNIPLQFSEIARNPGRYAKIKHITDNLQDGGEPPDFLENGQNVSLDGKTYPLDFPWTSADQLLGAPGAGEAGTAISNFNPIATLPLEMSSNHDYFKGKPIDKFGGKRVDSPIPSPLAKLAELLRLQNSEGTSTAKTAHLLQELAPLRTLGKALPQGAGKDKRTDSLMRILLGLGGYANEES